MSFVEHGHTLTMYLASGKKKHERSFWVERRGSPLGSGRRSATIMWDKSRRKKPRKSEPLLGFDSSPATQTAKEWFDHFDADGSGSLDVTELVQLYKEARSEKLVRSSVADRPLFACVSTH